MFITNNYKPCRKIADSEITIIGCSYIEWKVWNVNVTDSLVLGQHYNNDAKPIIFNHQLPAINVDILIDFYP